MSEYSGLKVAELKELLKSRGLSTSGTKPELIARLEENDNQQKTAANEGDHDASAAEKKGEPVTESNNGAVDQTTEKPSTEEVKNADTTTKPADTKTTEDTTTNADNQPEEKGEEGDQWAKLVIAEYERRLKRSKRFGIADEDTEQSLARVKKFGIEPAKAKKILTATMTQGKKEGRLGGVTKPPVEEAEKLKRRRERFAGNGA
ncbi:hypothetical protein TRICI_006735 [Trichomonascus ciferrii]|uniref:SAP domain-containing protein n=1 Tax=Trichomonascus ciferrii TaxID=44093 RepID=A0A642UE51_9ASCO|nr:hypothetical protein TRICI_006735 [Trichomonascus ciferrii]